MIDWELNYKVIDMHTHMGLEYCLYYPDHDADSMVRFMDEANIDFILSAPCEDLFDASSRRGGDHIRYEQVPGPDKGILFGKSAAGH